MGASTIRISHFKVLFAPLFLLCFCACEPPESPLKAKNKSEACSLLRESISMHNPPSRPFALFVPNENNVPRESEDKPGTALVPMDEAGRNFPLFGEKGLFMEQVQQIPRTMAKFELAKNSVTDVKVDQPFVAEATGDGVIVRFKPDSTWDGKTRSARLSVTIVDACGGTSTSRTTVVMDDGSKPANLGQTRANGTQLMDGTGFGSAGSSSAPVAFVNGGTTGSGTTGNAEMGHLPAPAF